MNCKLPRKIVIQVSGTPVSTLTVGSVIKAKVNNVAKDFLVVHQGNPSSSIYDTSCNGTWLLMKDAYEARQWSSSANDYANSTIHSYLNSTFFNLLESKAGSQIKQVKIPYRQGSGTSTSCNTGANGLSTKIFLLSIAEVGLGSMTTYEPVNEGTKLSYFTEGDSGNDGRIAKLDNTAIPWWLRSPYRDSSEDSTFAFNVQGGSRYAGKFDYSICNYDGNAIRPALVLNATAKCESNGDGTYSLV